MCTGKRVLALDVGLLMGGTKERGELESRVTNILSECRDSGNVILMCASHCKLCLPHNHIIA